MRAALLRLVRAYFTRLGFLEVDTPVRQPVVIPERNIIPLQAGNWFLQASPELCMKRLLAAGCEKIFQLCPCFRDEERGRLHLEEFMMLEWYRNGADYSDLIEERVWNLFPEADCIVFGHTHIPLCEKRGGILFINPGSFRCTGPFGSPASYAILTVGQNGLQANIRNLPLS